MLHLLQRVVPGTVLAAGVLALVAALFMPLEESATPPDEGTPVATVETDLTPLGRDTSGAENYDLSFVLELDDASARMLLVTSFPNGIFAEVGPDRAELGELAAGERVRAVGANLRSAGRHRVLLKRRGGRFFLVVDDMLSGAVSQGFVPPEELAVSGRVALKDLTFTPLREVILFGDDFMREMNERSPWEDVSGRWEVVGLKNPSLSANPFRLSSIGADALTVAGKPQWDEYRAAASVMGAGEQAIGLVFSYRGPQDYFLFRCHAGGVDKQAEIIRYRNGGYSLLATAPVRYATGIWYRMTLACSHGRARVLMDERPVISVEDPFITGGRFGLYASGIKRSWFDDIVVGPWLEAAHSGKVHEGLFQPLCGHWRSENGRMEMRTAPATLDGRRTPGLFVAGPFPAGMSASARLLSGEGGIAVGAADPLNFLALVVGNGAARIVRYRDGTPSALAEKPLTADRDVALKFTVSRGIATAEADDLHFSVPTGDDPAGGAGLVALSSGTRFGLPVTASIPPRREELRTGNATFAFEMSMASWAGGMSDWARGEGNSYWYQGFLPGDAEIAASLTGVEVPAGATIGLGLRKSGAGKSLNGYSLVVKRSADTQPQEVTTDGSDEMQLDFTLYREGDKVGETAASVEKAHSVALRTRNGAVVGELNGKSVLSWSDGNPAGVPGYKAAYRTYGMNLPPTSVLVDSPALFNYLFEVAPADWRPASGRWEITNRWQCDDRWSFFAGMLDPKDASNKLVLMWNKRRFRDPVRVEFFVAPQMHREKGNKYEYARDFNLSLSPDGRDTLSGYSFLFGAFNNTKSAIVRKGKVVASSTTGIIRRSMRIHRHWYHVVVTKDAGDLHFTVDEGRLLDLSYKDPEPLEAGRAAIWSHGCSTMVSRVRITGAGGGIDETPGTPTDEKPRTIYDLLAPEKGKGK